MSYDIDAVLMDLVAQQGSDVHFKVHTPVYFRRLDQLERTTHPVPTKAVLEDLLGRILSPETRAVLGRRQQADGIYTPEGSDLRFRVSVFVQRGSPGLVIRRIPPSPPTLTELGLPVLAHDLLKRTRGILLVTGPASSGKTTTVATLLSVWNETLSGHIVTLEDPIEYVFESRRSIVTQRQVGVDTAGYSQGLRRVLRQDPDIVFVGELLNLDTLQIAISAAETGHLVISTLYTPTVTTTLEHLIGMFPAQMQDQARVQLSMTIQGVMSQVLIPTPDRSRRVPAFEVLTPSESLRTSIRQGNLARIAVMLETTPGCITMATSLRQLVAQGLISREEAERRTTAV